MINDIAQRSPRVVNLSEMFVMLTNDVVCRIALGRKYGITCRAGEGGKTFNEILLEFVELLGTLSIVDFVPWLSWVSRINGLEAKLDNVAKQFDDFLERVIQEHVDSGHAHVENDDHKDFVDVLLEIQKGNLLGFPLDMVSIKALILVRKND